MNRSIMARVLAALLLTTTASALGAQPALAACSVDDLSASASGSSVQVHARGSCGSGVRAIRFSAGGNIIYELGAPSASASWTPGPGKYVVLAEVAGQGDNDWSFAGRWRADVNLGMQPTLTATS